MSFVIIQKIYTDIEMFIKKIKNEIILNYQM